MPGFYFAAWTALWVPKDTPKPIIARLSDAVRETLANPEIRRRLTVLAIEIPPPDELGPEKLAALHKAEVTKWTPIIKAANIKPE